MSSAPLPRVLVTGGSGFIGGWVTRILLQRGYPLRAQYRRPRPPEQLIESGRAGAEIRRVELTDKRAVMSAVEGMEAVIHCAALARDWGYEEQYRLDNVEATRIVAEQAREAGCSVFLFLSSLAVHGFGVHRGSTEEGPFYRPISGYQRSKREAERIVLSLDSPGFRVMVLRAGNVYGPGDTTTFYRLLAAQERGIRGTLGGGKALTSPVYITDLVEAVILALKEESAGGEVFIITGGEEVTWRQLMDYCAELLGVRPWLELPIPLAWVAAYLLNGIFRLLRIMAEPPIFPYRVAHVAWDYDFSIDKARRVLGYRPQVGWREGLARTVEAYKRLRDGEGTADGAGGTRPE